MPIITSIDIAQDPAYTDSVLVATPVLDHDEPAHSVTYQWQRYDEAGMVCENIVDATNPELDLAIEVYIEGYANLIRKE